MTATSFAEVLRSLRERRGVSQLRLAKMAGIHHSLVSRYESGSRWPTRATVLRLARVLQLSGPEQLQLLAAAGYLPPSLDGNLLGLVSELRRLLGDLERTVEYLEVALNAKGCQGQGDADGQ